MPRTIEISDETYEKIREQLLENEKTDINSYDDMVGKSFFIRTVTYHLVGKVTGRMGSFLRLSCASWVADSGRFMNAIKEGKLNEIEPVGDCWVNLNSVVDIFPWKHILPKEQK